MPWVFLTNTRIWPGLPQSPKDCRISDQLYRNALMVSPVFGPDAGYMAPVLHIGGAVPYKNQQLWIRLDRPESLAS
jgi:hypothetical protein